MRSGQILVKLKCCIFITNYFFNIKLHHAHQHTEKVLKDTLNAKEGVDKLCTIRFIQYVQWSKIG